MGTVPDPGSTGIGRFIGRYYPFLLVILAATAIVAFPNRDDADDVSTSAAGTESRPAGDAAGDATSASEDVTAMADTPTAIAHASAPSLGAQTAVTAPVGPAAADGTTFPGIGTPSALANPNCDAGRGRVKLPVMSAPPCVAPWPNDADNGGATSPGVTAETIRIVYLLSPTSTAKADEDTKNDVRAIWGIWERHLELWGRKLEFHFYKASGSDEVAQRADAIEVATSIKPFIAVTPAGLQTPRVWATELAARKIISYDTDALWKDTQAQAPFRWAILMDDGLHARLLGEYVAKALNGHKAKWAGEVTYQTAPRAFGLVHPNDWQRGLFDTEATRYGGVNVVDAVTYRQGGDPTVLQEQARVHATRLKDKKATSVLAVTDFLYTGLLTREASAQRYFPEWVITGWSYQDLVLFSRTFDQTQWQRAFGISQINLAPHNSDNWEQSRLYQWEYGHGARNNANNGINYQLSREIVPALSLSGPSLTPRAFQQAMFNKPPHGGFWAGGVTSPAVSFGRKWLGLAWDDYTSTDLMTEVWWDPLTEGRDEALQAPGPGTYWHIDAARQYVLGKFPRREPPMFDKSVAITRIDDLSPQERSPDYPPPSPRPDDPSQ